MNRHLPDVNVLLALLWQRHQGHEAAHAWFARSGHRAWATNPITQLGVLRLLTNRAITHGAVGAAAALDALHQATKHEAHEFWPLDRELTTGFKPIVGRLQGHGQWTDAVLLWEAVVRNGILVTFDASIKVLSTRETAGHLFVLKQG